MKMGIRNMINLRRIMILFGLTIFVLFTQANGITAEAKAKGPYLIKVNRVYNTITVYEQDDKGEYTNPIRVMLCSVGAGGRTTTGTFQTKEKYRWKLLMGNVWGQYSTRIVGGILFHSVYYYQKMNPATLATNQYNKLGTAASHGCVRLAVKDAKWIYDNCTVGTTVVIYDDKKSPGPLGKPDPIRIASNVRWDPTDPNLNNPYLNKKPTLTGIKDRKIEWSEEFNALEGVKAISSVGIDITSNVVIKGKVDTTQPGKYELTYSITDDLDKTVKKEVTVTVMNNKIAPEFTGISKRIVGPGVIIDEKFALYGVKAFINGKQMDESLIKISIKKVKDTEYEIVYRISIGNGPVETKKSKVIIDSEAPVITGIKDMTIVNGVIPGKDEILKDVKITDDYSKPENIEIDIAITENEDGNYQVTYTATDEVGNKTVEYSNIILDKEVQ